MNRMSLELYEALRCVMSEEKATQGAVRITEAVLGLNARQTTNAVRSDASQAGSTTSNFDTLSANLKAIRRETRINTCLLAVSVLLTFITCIKVYAS